MKVSLLERLILSNKPFQDSLLLELSEHLLFMNCHQKMFADTYR